MLNVKAALLLMLPLLLLASCSSPAAAPTPTATGDTSGQTSDTLIKLSLEELTDRADLIVVGTATSIDTYWNGNHTTIVTDISVSIETTVKVNPGRDR